MQTPPTVAGPRSSRRGRGERGLRACLLVSLACLVVQLAVTEYAGGVSQALFWLALGVLLLWLVYRYRSRVARVVLVVTAWLGAIVWALASQGRGGGVVIALLFAGQAAPLLLPPVRTHVRRR